MSTAPAMLSFNFEGTQLRGFEEGEESWFVAQDACALLGIVNSRDALSRLDEDEKGVVTTDTLGGRQQLQIVSESGLYVLIFRSRKHEAKRIRKWVTQEVLPTIRKTGRYELAANDEAYPSKGITICDTLGLDSLDDIERMRVKIALIREARHAYGPKSARGLWEAIGLPKIEALELPPPQMCLDDLDLTIRDWFEERCELQLAARAKGQTLFDDYASWCEAQSRIGCVSSAFGKQLRRAGFATFHSNGTWWRGIRLKD